MTSRHDLTVVLRFVAAIVAVVHCKVLRLWDPEEVEEERSKYLLRLFFVSSYKQSDSSDGDSDHHSC